jgi:hypothetical protein
MPTGNGDSVFVCPDFSPYNDDTIFNGTWIHIKTRELKFLTALASDDEEGGLIYGDDGPEFYFLAPDQIMETVNNSWEPWETVASRIAGRGIEFFQGINNVQGIAKALIDTDRPNYIRSFWKTLASSTQKVNYKVDTPLVYNDTERREWTLEFQLTGNSVNSIGIMMQAIRWLRLLSTPVRKDSSKGLSIELPYVFNLIPENQNGDKSDLFGTAFSKSNDYGDSNYCALTSFQPTYHAPYDEKGNPYRVSLTLTFKELSPLYAGYHSIKQ